MTKYQLSVLVYLSTCCIIPCFGQSSPMHYAFFGFDRERIHGAEFLESNAFDGAQLRYVWKELEPSRDVYDFSSIRSDLEVLTERQNDIDLLVTASPAAAQAMQGELNSDVTAMQAKAERLRQDIDALGTSGGYATEVMRAELHEMEADLQRYRGATANNARQTSVEPPTTSTVISTDAPLVYTDEGAIKNAYQTFAEEQGLSPDQARAYADRAYELTDGQVYYASGDPDQDGRPLTETELRQQRAEGRLDISPTRAQLGLLHIMAAQGSGVELPVGGEIGGAGLGPAFSPAFSGPPMAANVVSGRHTTEADIAMRILTDMAEGRPAFRPDLGQHGGTQWFVTDGNPYAGRSPDKPVTIPAEIANPTGAPVVEFNEAQLLEIFESERRTLFADEAARYRAANNIPADQPLSNTAIKKIERSIRGVAESRMWTRVGETVAASDSGVGRVNLVNSIFSKSGDGQFMLTSRADAVQVPGGGQALIEAIERSGEPVDNALRESVEQLATQQNWTGRVQSVFKYGGRVMVVVGAAADGYRIYTAENRAQETAEVVGGWGGAAAGSAAWGKFASPLLAGGPWGWVAYGTGALVAGGVGYVVGEKVGEEAYELVVDGDPIFIGPED